ncbi:hypothetical protein QFC19_003761 [Naganishia cerealis]|uniref:Uncharacterized protein n=1 Tax=Naganishia cerealis TaxID=610337 RepID=A0ACC2VZR6_9TREE|nr:hypothetical protein QFC19_003761 [Naganishia cerealis]
MLKSTIATCRRLLITKEAISPAYRPQLTTRRYLAFQTMTVPQHSSLSKIEINVDCGEAFGNWQAGPDEELMPMIDVANVACGGHAGSPVVMKRTIDLAKKFGVKVGAREW